MAFTTGKSFGKYNLTFIKRGEGVFEIAFQKEINRFVIDDVEIFTAMTQCKDLVHMLIRNGVLNTMIVRVLPLTNGAFKTRIVRSFDEGLIGFTYEKTTEIVNGATVHTYSNIVEEVPTWQLGETSQS